VERAYVGGMKDGIELYAWWKDGEQFVGSCGTTLKEAFDKIDKRKGLAGTLIAAAIRRGEK